MKVKRIIPILLIFVVLFSISATMVFAEGSSSTGTYKINELCNEDFNSIDDYAKDFITGIDFDNFKYTIITEKNGTTKLNDFSSVDINLSADSKSLNFATKSHNIATIIIYNECSNKGRSYTCESGQGEDTLYYPIGNIKDFNLKGKTISKIAVVYDNSEPEPTATTSATATAAPSSTAIVTTPGKTGSCSPSASPATVAPVTTTSTTTATPTATSTITSTTTTTAAVITPIASKLPTTGESDSSYLIILGIAIVLIGAGALTYKVKFNK